MNAVFMGTPEIAGPCLRAVVEWAGGRVRVVTQPDRPVGRSGQPQPPPVKVAAAELGLEVVQPLKLRGNAGFLAWLTADPPDLMVVVAFGQILPPPVLEVPPRGCLNVHFSQLPKYRGAAPVQWALINGETVTAVDVQKMDAGLDTGDVLASEPVAIEPGETAGELFARLGDLAPRVLLATLKEWSAGRLSPQPQDSARATLAPRLSKEEGRLDWNRPTAELFNRWRGVTPWPGATAVVAGEEVKVLRAELGQTALAGAEPGALLALEPERGLLVAAGGGALWLTRLQAPGRKPVSGAEYARGRRLEVRREIRYDR